MWAQALEIAPEQIHFKFNVAFVQIQLATTVYNMPEMQRTLAEVQEAAAGLEEAIESLDAIAKHPQTPYPKHDVEQRANMARNTMRRQLERSIQAQKEYEDKNTEKLKAAKDAREAELKKREETKLAAEKAERDRKLKIAEERQKIAEKDRELAELRAEEDRVREAAELTTDSETGEKVKRKKKPRGGGAGGKRKKKNEDGITEMMMIAEQSPREEVVETGVVVTATPRSQRRRGDWQRKRRSQTSTRAARLWLRATVKGMMALLRQQRRWMRMSLATKLLVIWMWMMKRPWLSRSNARTDER